MFELKEYFFPVSTYRGVPGTLTNTGVCGDLFGVYKPSI